MRADGQGCESLFVLHAVFRLVLHSIFASPVVPGGPDSDFSAVPGSDARVFVCGRLPGERGGRVRHWAVLLPGSGAGGVADQLEWVGEDLRSEAWQYLELMDPVDTLEFLSTCEDAASIDVDALQGLLAWNERRQQAQPHVKLLGFYAGTRRFVGKSGRGSARGSARGARGRRRLTKV